MPGLVPRLMLLSQWRLRVAVLGQMGVRSAPSVTKIPVTAVVAVLMVGAILGLLLIVFR